MTKNPLDWPLGLLVIVFAVVLFGWISFLEWIAGWRRTFARARQEREAWQRSQKQFDPNEIPADPRERLDWANRTGRYAPDAEKRE